MLEDKKQEELFIFLINLSVSALSRKSKSKGYSKCYVNLCNLVETPDRCDPKDRISTMRRNSTYVLQSLGVDNIQELKNRVQ
jgi:hypothetical protein